MTVFERLLPGLLFILASVLMAGFLIGYRAWESNRIATVDAPVWAAERAPDFTLPNLEGKLVSLSAYRGKVVFLNFWATWCPPCREEMPSMEILYRKLKGKKFEMLAVNVDRSSADKVKRFIQEGKYTFRVLHDAKNEVIYRYGIRGIPATYLIGKDGTILFKQVGGQDWAKKEIVEMIEKLIATTREKS